VPRRVGVTRFGHVPLGDSDHDQRQRQIDQEDPLPTWTRDQIAADEWPDCGGNAAKS